MPAEKIKCNRLPHTDLDEKCLQKVDEWDSVPASGVHCLRRLMSPAKNLFRYSINEFKCKSEKRNLMLTSKHSKKSSDWVLSLSMLLNISLI